MTVEWSPQAKIDFWNNINYLEAEWGEQVTANFIEAVENTIGLILEGNVSFRKTDYLDVLQVVVVKQITLFYSINDKNIRLLRFWNNYQDYKGIHL